MSLSENIARVRENIARAASQAGRDPSEIGLVAATKVQTSETIRAAIAAGIQICGENRVQELTGHLDDYAYDGAKVHFIGHLQTNKVKFVVGRVDLLESVDSPRLLEAVDKQAEKLGIVQDILLEVNIGGEESKGGCPVEGLSALARLAQAAPHVRLRGLMAIPPVSVQPGDTRVYFARTRQLFVDIRKEIGDNDTDIDCLSMGMSGDYEDAVREGATLVRVGTALFGPRPPCTAPSNTKGCSIDMGFIDELKRLARPYEDEEDEEFDDFEPVSRVERKEKPRDSREATGTIFDSQPEMRRSNKVVNIHTTTQLQVVLVKPDRFENAAEIADHLREKRTVVLNLEQTNKDIARRLLDFLSGVAYANEGKIKKVAISTYIITPYNVDILGDPIDELENNGLYF